MKLCLLALWELVTDTVCGGRRNWSETEEILVIGTALGKCGVVTGKELSDATVRGEYGGVTGYLLNAIES